MSWRSSRAATSTPPAWWTAPAGSCSRSGPCPASPRSPTPTRPGPAQVSADGQRSLVVVELAPELDDDAALAVAEDVAAALRRIDAPEVLVGGRLLAEQAFGEQAIEDAVVGESVALVVLAVALVVLLGGLVAAGVPLAVALAGVAGTLLALSLLTFVGPVSEFAVNVVTLLGIGLAIDYSLLMIYRFREERAARRRARPCPTCWREPWRRPVGPCSSRGSRWRRRCAACSPSPIRCSRRWRSAAPWPPASPSPRP